MFNMDSDRLCDLKSIIQEDVSEMMYGGSRLVKFASGGYVFNLIELEGYELVDDGLYISYDNELLMYISGSGEISLTYLGSSVSEEGLELKIIEEIK